MAMTGGISKQVKTGTPSGWPDSIKLYVYYKEKSRDIDKNETVLSLGMYITTPSGWGIGRWDDFYGSYIGTATSGSNCRSFVGTIPANTSGTLWLEDDQDFTVTHDDDGTKRLTIYWKLGVNSPWGGFEIPSGSFDIDLTTIPRASTIASASGVTLGNACSVKWTPHAASFRYKLKFQLGDWSYTTDTIHPNTTSAYTYSGYAIPIEVAQKIPSSSTGTMTVTLTTYSDSGATKPVGSADSETFTVTVPKLLPSVSMALTPVSSLPAAFNSLYIQGKTKVSATTLTATGQQGAGIKDLWISVEGKNYGRSSSFTSGYLVKSGGLTVTGYATDSRGNTGSTASSINVLPYSKPYLTNLAVGRCDSSGNLKDNGTYLRIQAKRNYSAVGGKNKCQIQYRFRLMSSGSYSSWVTILAKDATNDEIITSPLLSGNLSVKSTYEVQVRAIDDIGEYASKTVKIPTDKVFCHRGWNSISFGGYIEEDNTFAITGDMKFKVKNEAWESLGLSNIVTPSVTNIGRGPEGTGCWYRVVNGNHVQIAFNCAVEYAGVGREVSLTAIPEQYRPQRNVSSVCSINGQAVAGVLVNSSGDVFLNWVQDLTATGKTTSYSVSWIDGYIDYYL